MSSFPRAFVLALALSTAGCTSGLLVSHEPPLRLFVLQAMPAGGADASAPAAAGTSPSLGLAPPFAAPGLDTDRIALLQPGSRLDYYAGSRWSGPLSEALGSLAVEILRRGHEWSTVADPRMQFSADYQLQIGIERFEADYTGGEGPPVVSVRLHGLLTRRIAGGAAASFTVASQRKARENRMGSVIEAFEAAVNDALAQMAAQAVSRR